MRHITRWVRSFADVRPGEHLRLWSMFFYLLFVLFAYYIVKPVSRAMFLTKFDIDKLPLLYILIAAFGGVLAYFYAKVAAQVSLKSAVTWAMGLSVATLLLMWWLIRLRIPWMVYVLNIWVSLFSVVLVSQGWLVASNLFNAWEAKRLYPILDIGMVVGAAFGGEFTREAVALIGTENLLLASAVMVALAYAASLVATRATRSDIKGARAGDEKDTDFSFPQMIRDIASVRNVRIIVAMMVVMFLIDTLVEYQFQAVARVHYRGDHLTAFFGEFYGFWLNGVEFLFQFFLTVLIVRWFGVGITLQISPVAVGLSSFALLGAPGVASASGVRLIEASTRYTLTKTGMELLYMPIPLALRNRVKAFIDICVDRLSRGIGGVLLLFVTAGALHLGVRGIAVIVVGLAAVWAFLAEVARKGYVNSVSLRFASRRLDMKSLKVAASASGTIQVLETAARGDNAKQAIYALTLLSKAPGYDMKPMIVFLAQSPIEAVREHAYQLATDLRFDGVLNTATGQLDETRPEEHLIRYLLTVSPAREVIASDLLRSKIPEAVSAAVGALGSNPELAKKVISMEWVEQLAQSTDPRWRAVAAECFGACSDSGFTTLRHLLEDQDYAVRRAAVRSAGILHNRTKLYEVLDELLSNLADARLRKDCIRAIGAYGSKIIGSLSDVLNDDETRIEIRRQIPRVLQDIPDQQAVDVLLRATASSDLSIRTAALRALNRLRITSPGLTFDDAAMLARFMAEARTYYELDAVLASFSELSSRMGPVLRLLARTIKHRLNDTLMRLFYILGLRYPPREVHSAYLAVAGREDHNDKTAALEFLDNLLDHNLKRVLLPLLDAPQNLLDHAEALFGVRRPTLAAAIQMQMESGDSWLAACATAAAAEVGMHAVAERG